MPSKEKDDAVGRCESDLNKSARVGSDSGEQDEEFRDQCSPEERGNVSDDAPWEKRYEKIWVEVEKREVKSTFKNVAGELKEKFGELFKSRHPAENVTEEEDTSTEEESSDEEEGEIIVRPMARARSTVLLTIPEQRESGLEDSAAESTDNSICEDRMQRCEQPAGDGSIHQEPDLLTDDPLEFPSPQLTTEQRQSTDSMTRAAKAFTNSHTIPMYAGDHNSVLKNETKHMDPALKDTAADLSEAEDDPEEFNVSQPFSLRRCSASIPGVSDEELEEDMERFKLEVGMLKVVFLSLEKEKAQLQKEVEDGRPSHSHF